MSEYVDVIILYSQVSADVIFDYDISTLKFKRPYNSKLSITIIRIILSIFEQFRLCRLLFSFIETSQLQFSQTIHRNY